MMMMMMVMMMMMTKHLLISTCVEDRSGQGNDQVVVLEGQMDLKFEFFK